MPLERSGRPYFSETLARQYEGSKPLDVAVVYPCDGVSLRGAVLAAKRGVSRPLLVGPEERINELAGVGGLDIEDIDIHDVEYDFEAAEVAARMARSGEVSAIMKGSLHTDVLMRAIVSREAGLRTSLRMSHVFAIDHPGYHKLLLVTDAAINIAPSLGEKRDIVQNAINLAQRLGVGQPKVALLAAVETVEEDVEATLHAAALCKMADRKQIQGGVLDGPLALDNALSAEAARIKGIDSPVAGDADILVVPHYEAGNMLAKEMEHLGGAHIAGLVIGARVPVILTSRADSEIVRIASCLLAKAYAKGVREPL
jgi:phosphate acetyltransferase/phosphate butyryltransferase